MSTDAVDTTSEQPSVAEVGDQQPGKVMRIAATIKQLAEEVHAEPLDAPSRNRLRKMHARTISELQNGLPSELREELQRLALPFTDDSAPSDAELRIAQAQLKGWLEGLFRGIQTVLTDQQTAGAASSFAASSASPTSPRSGS